MSVRLGMCCAVTGLAVLADGPSSWATDVPTQASAATRPVAELLEVSPGVTCIEASELAEQMRARLGTGEVEATLAVRVEGSTEDPRTVSFRVSRAGETVAERRFAPGPERCDHLHATLGLAIALAIKVSLLDEQSPRDLSKRGGAAVSTDDWSAGVNAWFSSAVLPGVAPGLELRVVRRLLPHFTIRGGVLALATWDKTFDRTAGRFDAGVVALRADACVTVRLVRRVGLGGCAGLIGGGLLATGSDFVEKRSAWLGWFALASGVESAVELGDHWALDVAAVLVLPLQRTSIGVRTPEGGVVDAHESAPVGGAVTLGPEYRF